MGDRQLFEVAMGAFGLTEEIYKGAFVRKILAEGTEDSSAFAVRLNSTEYLALAETFQVDADENLTISEEDIARVVDAYQRQAFEVEVGEQDESMRLALNFERRISEFAGQGSTEAGGWYTLMGSTSMLQVIQGGFGAPDGLTSLDIEVQKDFYVRKSKELFGDGSIEALLDPENADTLIQQYLFREEIEAGPSANTPGMAALSILSATSGSSFASSSSLFTILAQNY